MIGSFLVGSEPEMVDLLVTDYGTAHIPAHIADVINTVPCRVDGEVDRRFKTARRFLEWEARMNRLAAERFMLGIEPATVVEPFEP